MSIHLHWHLPTNGDNRDIVGSGDGSQKALTTVRSGCRFILSGRPQIEVAHPSGLRRTNQSAEERTS
jgi:hypothetical protein